MNDACMRPSIYQGRAIESGIDRVFRRSFPYYRTACTDTCVCVCVNRYIYIYIHTHICKQKDFFFSPVTNGMEYSTRYACMHSCMVLSDFCASDSGAVLLTTFFWNNTTQQTATTSRCMLNETTKSQYPLIQQTPYLLVGNKRPLF